MPSYDVKSGDKSTLAAKINSSQTSGVTIAAMNINGASTQWGNTAGVIEVSEQTDGTLKREWIYYTGISFDSSNVGTLSGVVRGLARDTSDTTSGGTGQAFSKGAVVRFVTFHDLFNKKANIDRANSWSGTNTFATGGKIVFTGTAVEQFVSQGLTTAQRDALVNPADGTLIYNSTTGQMNYREGGAWVANASGGSVANGSTTVAGKFEEATVAEQGTSTATGATGARLVPAVENLVKTSAGAGDANKIPILGASGTLATGFLGTGTPTAAKYLLGDGTWGTIRTSRVSLIPDDAQRKSAAAGTLLPAYETVTSGSETGLVHTNAITNNGNYLVVGFILASGTDTITSVTYGGQAMTRAESYINTPTGESNFLYVLNNAPQGANNLVITISSSVLITWSAASYYWMSTAEAFSVAGKGTGSGSSSGGVTTTVDNSWLVGWGRAAGGTVSAGAGTTKRSASAEMGLFDANGPTTPAGADTLNTTGTGTNVMIVAAVAPTHLIDTLDFDASTDEYADFVFTLPPEYAGGTINVKVSWVATATSGNVVWTAKGAAWGDGDVPSDAFGTAVSATDSLQPSKCNVADLGAMTLSGSPVAGDYVCLRVTRDADNGSDTLAVDAKLLAIEITV